MSAVPKSDLTSRPRASGAERDAREKAWEMGEYPFAATEAAQTLVNSIAPPHDDLQK